MYNLNEIEQIEYQMFCELLNKKQISTYIKNNMIFITKNQKVIIIKKQEELTITTINDILELDLIDNKYLYYLIKQAYENEKHGKIKSLRL